MNIIKGRLRLLREARGLTTERLAEMAGGGMKASTISLLETGSRSNPHVSTLSRLAVALGTTIDYIVGLTDNPTPSSNHHHDEQLQRVVAAWPILDNVTAKETVADLASLLAKKEQLKK